MTTKREQILLQDIARLEEEKASLKKSIMWNIRQKVESSLMDTRDIDPAELPITERILVRHLHSIDRVLSDAYTAS
jgi:hypothetical protein